MRRRVRFDFGAETWTTELSARPWLPSDNTVGGSRTSAGGIPASYIVRRDELLEVPLRVTEAEWDRLVALVTFGQTAADFLFFPDADENVPVQVYLEAPAAGERWTPARMSQYERVFEQTVTLRAVDPDYPIWTAYFDA